MQLDAKEDASRFYNLHSAVFPITVQAPANIKYVIESWEDVSNMLLNPIGGQELIVHARTLRVQVAPKTWRTISLESLAFIPEIAMFLIDYSRATSSHIKGYLFSGDLGEQPHIYYGLGQAFDVIASAKSECELENIRVSRQKANKSGEQ